MELLHTLATHGVPNADLGVLSRRRDTSPVPVRRPAQQHAPVATQQTRHPRPQAQQLGLHRVDGRKEKRKKKKKKKGKKKEEGYVFNVKIKADQKSYYFC